MLKHFRNVTKFPIALPDSEFSPPTRPVSLASVSTPSLSTPSSPSSQVTRLGRRVGAITAMAAVAILVAACGESTNANPPASSTSASATPAGQCSYPAAGGAAKQVKKPASSDIVRPGTVVKLDTNRGTISFTLDSAATPCTSASFVSLTRQGYFDKTKCHRLTTAGIYVLQCGSPTGSGSDGPGYSFADELPASAKPKNCDASGCRYPAGTVAMANAGPNTNGSQFFLVYADSPLPYRYAIFGTMDAASLTIVKKIAAGGSNNSNEHGDGQPNLTVSITKASVK